MPALSKTRKFIIAYNLLFRLTAKPMKSTGGSLKGCRLFSFLIFPASAANLKISLALINDNFTKRLYKKSR